MYGAGGPKLARIAGFPDSMGESMKRKFYSKWKCLELFQEDLKRSLGARGFLKGLCGRSIYAREGRTALNAYIQQAAAEVFKSWMLECYTWTSEFNRKGPRSIYQVIAYHDELQFEMDTEDIRHAELVASRLSSLSLSVGKTLGLKVPINSEYKVGTSWRETH